MVDLLGMFRRRPAKRPAGFGRSREDITTLGDSFGDMLSQPLRDAPPIARDDHDLTICSALGRSGGRHSGSTSSSILRATPG